jgi:hypothetical protein
MESEAIKKFFKSIKELRTRGVIRSDKYLGDIGEYICKEKYGIELCESGRQEGHDGELNGNKYQIKFHNSPTRTNIYFGNPNKYDKVLIVIGPESKLRSDSNITEFHIYQFDSSYVKRNFAQVSGYCCGKRN